MKKIAAASALLLGTAISSAAFAQDLTVGVSWSNFQEERWKTDEAAAEDIPVVGYDRLIEDDRAFYSTFDNKGVGRIIAEAVQAVG